MAYASRQQLAELEARVQALEESRTRKELAAIPEYVADVPIPDLDLDDRYKSLLIEAGYETIPTIQKASDQELLEIPGIGPAVVKKIRQHD